MEPKRELSSVDLAALVRELDEITEATVDKAYLYGDDLLRLKLRHYERGRIELLIEIGDVKRAHIAAPEHVSNAPERPPDFARKLRDRISGAEFVGVEQYEFDRILRFEFERPDGHTTIVAELFGDGNIAVLDATNKVVDCLETIRLQSRSVVPGSQYEFPASRVNPLAIEFEEFVARMDESDSDLVRTLATQLNLGGFYAEELCQRADVEKTRSIEEATDAEYEALYSALETIAELLRNGQFDPRVYLVDEEPVDVVPFPVEEHADLAEEAYETFNEALDAYFAAVLREETEPGDDRPDFAEQIAKRERIIDHQETAIENFVEEAEQEREKAEVLYAEYDIVDEILSTVRAAREDDVAWEEIEARLAAGAEQGIPAAQAVSAVDPESGMVTVELAGRTIDLDPSNGVEKNADRLYQAAKDIEAKREGALEALEETKDELAALKERRDEWEADPPTDDEDSTREVAWRDRSSIPIRQPDHWYERFRWFETSDEFLVLGGRNADQNEELVKKYLEPGDRFFHAQAAGAPVTILKATGPSEPTRDIEFPSQSLNEAAQFAVSYSSVWKDGRYAGDAYMVTPEQVSKTPESGEYLEKGSFVIRGDRTYFSDTEVGCAVGILCEPETRVIGGPPSAITNRVEISIEVEPGRFAQGDVAKRIYREFREAFDDTAFVRKVASPDKIAEFLPPGQSRIIDD